MHMDMLAMCITDLKYEARFNLEAVWKLQYSGASRTNMHTDMYVGNRSSKAQI